MVKELIRVINAALDEDEKGNIILRGVLDPQSLYLLKVGPYQREVLPKTKMQELLKAYDKGSVPDIELGMRGGGFLEKDGGFLLQDDCYIIDGLQRTTAARKLMDLQKIPRVGCITHFNTTEDWERERFRILNTMHTRLSPNVLIRNMENKSEIVALMRNLCLDKNFVLYEKVSWNQRMNRTELITAYTLLKTIGFLHSGFGPTRTPGMLDLTSNLDEMYAKIGRNTMRENIKDFWEFMDECYRIRFVTYKEGAAYLKQGFLSVIASVLADHANFWRDSKLFIEKDLRKKISTFPISDPEIVRLAGAGGSANELLRGYLIEHINSGKRTKKLEYTKKSFLLTPAGNLRKPKKKEKAA